MKPIYAFSRQFFGVTASMLLLMSAMYAFDVPADLPSWRKLLGIALFCAAAMVFEKFTTE